MDTGEVYIKMCEKAEEIQELCSYNRYDYFGVRNTSYTFRWGRDNKPRGEYIWLPRQDELQEMIPSPFNKPVALCLAMEEYIIDTMPEIEDYSMEQLWLAFVMKEKYGKIWDGSEWTK